MTQAFLLSASSFIFSSPSTRVLCRSTNTTARGRPFMQIASLSLPPMEPQTATSVDHNTIKSRFADRGRENLDWINVSSMRNALLKNHFIDLLEVHGERYGLERDRKDPNWQEAGCYSMRMQNLSIEFREQVANALASKILPEDIVNIPYGVEKQICREETKHAMGNGAKMIVGAIVGDDQTRLYARIPLLLRIDVANDMFSLSLVPEDEQARRRLYVAVGTKRRPVTTNAAWFLKKRCLSRVQHEMHLWNYLLTNIQGPAADCAVLVGLHPKRKRPVSHGSRWKQNGANTTDRPVFENKIWRVAMVSFSEGGVTSAMEAIQWRTEVVDHGTSWIDGALKLKMEVPRSEGSQFNGIYALAKYTTDVRKRPNMKCHSIYDFPWATAKKQLACDLNELTMVAGLGRDIVETAMANGVPNDFTNADVTGKALGVETSFVKATLDKCRLDYSGPLVTPELIPHNRLNWRRLQDFNPKASHQFDKNDTQIQSAEERTFYIDLEMASPDMMYADYSENVSADHIGDNAEQDGAHNGDQRSFIAMIGCGQMVDKVWKHRVFAADSLSQAGESAIMRQWFQHLNATNPVENEAPILYVWGPEKSLLKNAKRRMTDDDVQAVDDMRSYSIVNMLDVVLSSCVSIKGVLNNKISTVAAGLDMLGLLADFGGRPVTHEIGGGADAMALVLDAAEAVRKGEYSRLPECPNLKVVAAYNEDDCRDIACIADYLRMHH